MQSSRTFCAIPPGYAIKEALEFRGMTQKEFAARIGYTQKHVTQLLKGDCRLTNEMALRLETVLGAPAYFWNGLEAAYREDLQKVHDENQLYADIERIKGFPYGEMAKRGWVEPTRSPKQRVLNLRKFFEVAELEFLEKEDLAFYTKARLSDEPERIDYCEMSFIQQAKRQARDIDVKKVDVKRLASVWPEVRALTLEKPEVFRPKLSALLARYGVAVVYLEQIGKVCQGGVTLSDGSKIVVGLTVSGRTSDEFWLGFCHELENALMNRAIARPGAVVPEVELLPAQSLAGFISDGRYSEDDVLSFADSVGIDPGVVVGWLQQNGLLARGKLNNLKRTYAVAE